MIVLTVVAILIGLLALLPFPWVGVAMLPVVSLGALAIVAWLVVVLTRGLRALTQRRTPVVR